MSTTVTNLLKHLLEDEDDDILDAGDMMPDYSTSFRPGDTTEGWLKRVLPSYGFKRGDDKGLVRSTHGWVKVNGPKKMFMSKTRWNSKLIAAREFLLSNGEWKDVAFYTFRPGEEALEYLNGTRRQQF